VDGWQQELEAERWWHHSIINHAFVANVARILDSRRREGLRPPANRHAASPHPPSCGLRDRHELLLQARGLQAPCLLPLRRVPVAGLAADGEVISMRPCPVNTNHVP
jgi:hypothetical protein